MKKINYLLKLLVLILVSLVLAACAQQIKQEQASLTTSENTLPAWVQEAPLGTLMVEEDKVSELSVAREKTEAKAKKLLAKKLFETAAIKVEADLKDTYLGAGSLEHKVKKNIQSQIELDISFNLVLENEWFDEENQHYFGLYSIEPITLKQSLSEQLLTLDSQLSDYKHATHLGSELEQLWSLAPVLPSLEARRIIKKALVEQFGDLPALENDYLAKLIDLQLSGLFNRMNISVDSLTAETAIYESFLVDGLKESGLNISARRPSLMVNYYIEQYIEDDEVVLVADIELNYRNGSRFAQFSDELVVSYEADESVEEVKNLAYLSLADDLTNLLLSKLYTHIKVFNEHRFGR